MLNLLKKRCAIPECDRLDNVIFNADWLKYSVPFQNGKPNSCHRFDTIWNVDVNETKCNTDTFNRSSISNCANGTMIFRTNDVSILNQVLFFSFQLVMITENEFENC